MSTTSKNQTFKRLSINLPPELDRVVLDLRKTEEYCRCSYVEIIRVLMAEGAETLIRHQDNGMKAKGGRWMNQDTKAFLRAAAATVLTLAFCAAMPFVSLHAAAALVTAPAQARNAPEAERPVVIADKLWAPARREAGEDPREPQLIEAALVEQGYFREDVPLSCDLQDALHTACVRYDIDYAVALGLIEVESGFQPDIVNAYGDCYGLCQLNMRYFPSGLPPEENINHGLAYLRKQLDRYGSLEAALQAYHDGYDTGARWYARAVLGAAEKWS